jgi:F0F1-type ATP synthase assembly protein I
MPAQSVGFSTLLGLGAAVAVQLVVMLALGLVVDSLAGTSPVFLLIGLVLGIASAVWYTVRKFREFLSVPSPAPDPGKDNDT